MARPNLSFSLQLNGEQHLDLLLEDDVSFVGDPTGFTGLLLPPCLGGKLHDGDLRELSEVLPDSKLVLLNAGVSSSLSECGRFSFLILFVCLTGEESLT